MDYLTLQLYQLSLLRPDYHQNKEMVKKYWIKGSVVTYVACLLGYNFFGKSTTGWTDFYYTFEKGFAFLSTMWSVQQHDLSDRLFIDYARITQCGTWIFFILCSFNTPWWVYHQTFLVSILIASSFGTVCVNYWLIKNKAL